MLDGIKKKNPDLNVICADTASRLFRKLKIDVSELTEYSVHIDADQENTYTASDGAIEETACVKNISREVFAEATVQAGWCCGGGTKMNGMEWHKSAEVIVACTDMALLIGDYFDIKDDVYDSAKAVALFLNKGEAVELLPMTLHLAPLSVNGLFKAVIILPKGTNAPLERG
ncbi:MAG: DUF4867 family protein, partial [Clostridia bacterium]|nr:DUF4867 family protein [Clostridia bacterium]